MSRQIPPLSDTGIKKAKPTFKPFKLSDGAGLYLLVMPTGSRWWRLDYRFGGKRQTISMGVYPDVSLKQARGLQRGDSPVTLENDDNDRRRVYSRQTSRPGVLRERLPWVAAVQLGSIESERQTRRAGQRRAG